MSWLPVLEAGIETEVETETEGVEEMIGIPWQLGQWRVFEVQLPGRPDRTRHFAGYSVALRIPKVAGPIVEFDLSTKRGTDETGGVFALIGVSRGSADVDKAWDAWVRRVGATSVKDISKDVNKAWVAYPGSEVVDWRQNAHAIGDVTAPI